MRYFVTGTGGFIGYHLAARLLDEGHQVAGYDGLTTYYDVELKQARIAELRKRTDFDLIVALLEDRDALRAAITGFQPDIVVHLAAQAGVRYALEAPEAYIQSNITGTFNLLEVLRESRPQHFLFASTSSVYGGNTKMPFAETDRTDYPVSLYAATKKAGEAMCHSYAHLFGIPTTAFRFFTVYGPWGRPDMALFKFVRAISRKEPIEVYGQGQMARDFTYIDDLIDVIVSLTRIVPGSHHTVQNDSESPVAPFRTINIAGGAPVHLMEFVTAIESAMGCEAEKIMRGMQPGDVVETHADASLLDELVGQVPSTPISEGVSRFVAWYRSYYGAEKSEGDAP
ncbi:NAD-dependent epimerase/dehydratase family protein [Mycolicibacterium sp. PAM1]|uniref:NAD-dependent epimerase/dehydratase family protein n=1 Tax=Mycolicibacterium sp. PAM1 TaxID=2853535 RepID=UPI001C3D77B9|nr:NAD-dependent epimerase/dehydratase family protein [Mycolicibacterium sp. PAM1]MBV5246888.1 NAD-dependent epimerase/dehydratase family protein [Mycolicibacterium sp. PAM1]